MDAFIPPLGCFFDPEACWSSIRVFSSSRLCLANICTRSDSAAALASFVLLVWQCSVVVSSSAFPKRAVVEAVKAGMTK